MTECLYCLRLIVGACAAVEEASDSLLLLLAPLLLLLLPPCPSMPAARFNTDPE